MYIEQLYTNCLAEAAYYIESDGVAAVIDPIRETEPYLALANRRGATIRYIFETHFHADFVSGHIDLSKKTGATIVFGPQADTAYEIHRATHGEVFSIGKIKIKVLHTPGHTPESTCYLLVDEQGKDHAVFTGDTLFVGDVGRPDLLDGKMSREELASLLFDSLNKVIRPLADDVIVYPAHGPGSACGKNIGKETFSTIGEQKKLNYALKATTREQFIKEVTEGILPPPQYFFEDARINKQGYESVDAVVERNTRALSAAEVADHVKNGALILDTRTADEFEKGFIEDSLNIGLNGQFAVWVGTLINIHQPLVIIAAEGKEAEAILRLARVGYENVVGYLNGGVTAWNSPLQKVHSIQPTEMKSAIAKGALVIDVRKPTEWAKGHVADAQLKPLGDMPANLQGIDRSKQYLVHCGGGYRSMSAISIMLRNGFTNLINIYGGFGAMQHTGLSIVKEEETVSA